jgi:hypothetical protein
MVITVSYPSSIVLEKRKHSLFFSLVLLLIYFCGYQTRVCFLLYYTENLADLSSTEHHLSEIGGNSAG